MACPKGKTTRKKPEEFLDETTEMPLESSVRMHEVIIHMDDSHMSRMTFPSCMAKPMFHREAMPSKDVTAETLCKVLDKIA